MTMILPIRKKLMMPILHNIELLNYIKKYYVDRNLFIDANLLMNGVNTSVL